MKRRPRHLLLLPLPLGLSAAVIMSLAAKLLAFLKGPEARTVDENYGYGVGD
jgi:hypothetical protein